jgi:VanZ family protein
VDQRSRHQLRVWLIICVAISIALFAIAISNAAYEATSPSWLTFHVLLRKAYSVVAFALVGFTLARTTQLAGRAWTPVQVGLSVGLYSALIEVCQRFLAGARESFAQQSVDVAAGLIGGALGALAAAAFLPRGLDGGS